MGVGLIILQHKLDRGENVMFLRFSRTMPFGFWECRFVCRCASSGEVCRSTNACTRTGVCSFLTSTGKWKCCRVRFEVNNLIHRSGGPKVLARYMKVYARMTRHKKTQADFRAIVEAHRTLFLAGIHTLPSFGAWHRWYLLQVGVRRVCSIVTQAGRVLDLFRDIESVFKQKDRALGCGSVFHILDFHTVSTSHSWRVSSIVTQAGRVLVSFRDWFV